MINKINNEPLFINLSAPCGTYNITVSLTAYSNCVFSISEKSTGTVTENVRLDHGENKDICFTASTKQDISIQINCNGDICATAAAEYVG